MAEITASAVKELREKTGLPMMDCKQALAEAKGDMEKAIEGLRIRGKKVQEKQAGRSTSTGRIAVFSELEPGVGALIDLRCESAPVANNEYFIGLANDLAQQLAKGPGAATPDELARSAVAQPEGHDAAPAVRRLEQPHPREIRSPADSAGRRSHGRLCPPQRRRCRAVASGKRRGRRRIGPRYMHAHRGHEADRPAQRGPRSGLGGQRARRPGPGDDAGSRNHQEGSGADPCPAGPADPGSP